MSDPSKPSPKPSPKPAPTPTPSSTLDISQISGNAPDTIKRIMGSPQTFFGSFLKPGQRPINGFGNAISERMVVTELSVDGKQEAKNKLEARAVLEIDVTEDMVNASGNMHGGCTAFLIDMASSFALSTLTLYQEGSIQPSVSQALNVVYHSPATVGERLRMINTSISVGKRTESVRTEIWNATHSRLVATGIHVKMSPSPPPVPKASL